MDLHIATTNGIGNGNFAVFDGRLLNAAALANQLDVRPDDGAAILHAAFLKWGEDFPRHLDGSFAAAVFDLDGERLLLARDPLGTIPLYVAKCAGGIAFASRLDEFLASRIVGPVADFQSIWNYLTLGAVPLPYTILKGVQGLRPAELAVVDLRTGGMARRAWWSLPAVASSGDAPSAAEIRARLTAVVEAQSKLFGAYRLLLSGGLDSCILLAILSGARQGVPTLTIGYETRHKAFDETAAAREAARHFGASAKFAAVSSWEVSKNFSRFIQSMDSPSRDGLNMYFAVRAAKAAGASAVVTGLGGDELFGGYAYLRRHLKAERLSRYLGMLHFAAGMLPDRFRHNLLLPMLTPAERLETIRAQAYDGQKRRFVNPQLLEGRSPISWLDQCRVWADESLDPIRRLTRFDICLDMDHTLLRDGYNQAHANAVGLFAPLACPEIAEFAWRIPSDSKVRNGRGKAILQDAFSQLLPPQILNAPKRGFEMPLLAWLGSTLLPRAKEAFMSDQARMVFSETACRNWAERLEMLQPGDYPLWSRFILVEWLRARNIRSIQ